MQVVNTPKQMLPIFFRASVYALAAASFATICNVAFGYGVDPVSVFALVLSGYLMGSLGGME